MVAVKNTQRRPELFTRREPPPNDRVEGDGIMGLSLEELDASRVHFDASYRPHAETARMLNDIRPGEPLAAGRGEFVGIGALVDRTRVRGLEVIEQPTAVLVDDENRDLWHHEQILGALEAANRLVEQGDFAAAADVFYAEAQALEAALPRATYAEDQVLMQYMADAFYARASALRATTPNAMERHADAAMSVAFWLNQNLMGNVHGPSGKEHVLGNAIHRADNTRFAREIFKELALGAHGLREMSRSWRASEAEELGAFYRAVGGAVYDKQIAASRGSTKQRLQEERVRFDAALDDILATARTRGLSFDDAYRAHNLSGRELLSPTPEQIARRPSYNRDLFGSVRDPADTLKRGAVGDLFGPMISMARAVESHDVATVEREQARLIVALQEENHFDIAASVMEQAEATTSTPEGRAALDAVKRGTSQKKWEVKFDVFMREEAPLLIPSMLLSGGVGAVVRGGAYVIGMGRIATAATALTLESLTFVASSKALNMIVNDRAEDWRAGTLAQETALTAGGVLFLRGAARVWRAGTTAASNYLARASTKAIQAASREADDVLRAIDEAISTGPKAGQRGVFYDQTLPELRMELEKMRGFMTSDISQSALAEARGVLNRAQRFATRAKGLSASGGRDRALKSELAAEYGQGGFKASIYEAQARLQGVVARPATFSSEHVAIDNRYRNVDRVITEARARNLDVLPDGAGNVAVADLRVGMRTYELGARHSRMPLVKNGNGRWEQEARRLSTSGYGSGPRNGDTEIQFMEMVDDILKGNANASGTLRIFSERAACSSCLRVMARFKEAYPKLNIEVLYR